MSITFVPKFEVPHTHSYRIKVHKTQRHAFSGISEYMVVFIREHSVAMEIAHLLEATYPDYVIVVEES